MPFLHYSFRNVNLIVITGVGILNVCLGSVAGPLIEGDFVVCKFDKLDLSCHNHAYHPRRSFIFGSYGIENLGTTVVNEQGTVDESSSQFHTYLFKHSRFI